MRSGRSRRGGPAGKARPPHERAFFCAASHRPCLDPLLSIDVVQPARPPMPLLADLLGIRRRGDRPAWPVGRVMDEHGARLPLPPLGRIGLRSAPRDASDARFVAAAVALRPLATSQRLSSLLASSVPDL